MLDLLRSSDVKRSVEVLKGLTRVTIALLVAGWCVLWLRAFDQKLGIMLPPWTIPLGVLLMVVGGSLVLACGGMLSAGGLGTRRGLPFPKEFVAAGPFRYVRNPMSVGAVTLMLGFGLLHRSISIAFASVCLFIFIHVIVVTIEEPGLAKRFDGSYIEYKQSVKRWIPRWR